MKQMFRKAMTVLASTALVGATVGVAAAASYPTPFQSNTAIVVGANAAASDNIQAGNIASNLDALSAGTGGVVTETEGDVVALDSGSTRIWLNTSLDVAKSTLTKSDLPVVLGDNTFSGNVDAKLTSTIKIPKVNPAGSDNSGAVIFAKQPKSNVDPVVGISMNSTAAAGLYNATVTMKATNFTHADSEGETITLFGRDFVVSTATDATSIVLFSSAQEVNLVAGGSSANPSTTVVIDGTSYDVELVTGTSSTATIAINGESREINEGASRKINGIDVAVKSVTESTALDTVTATLLVGSEKITFTDGSEVTKGSDDDPVDGTLAYIIGGTGATTELTVTVSRPDSQTDAILPGTPFVDPVYGSFKVDFQGLSNPLNGDDRDVLNVGVAGDDTMTLSVNGDSFDWAHNQSNQFRLGDDSNYTIYVKEMANASEDEYMVVGNEEYGRLLKVIQLYNNTGTDYTKDVARFEDVLSGDTYTATFTTEGSGTMSVEGKQYTVTLVGADTPRVQLKYPTSDSASSSTFVVYPTFQTERGANVALYEPLNINLGSGDGAGTDVTGLIFPDGDGYTTLTIAYGSEDGHRWNVSGASVSGSQLTLNSTSFNSVDFTIGQFKYNLSSTATTNVTLLQIEDPEGTAVIDGPGIIMFYGRDDNSNYEGLLVDTKDNPAGSSTNGVEVNDVLFTTQEAHYSASLDSDSDITQDVDWWGTLVSTDANDDQSVMTIRYPKSQVYSQIFIGETSASVGGGEAGVMTVTDSESASVAGKNLIVVGGSAINSVAAELLGGAYKEGAFTDATGVGAGEFLIQSFDRSGKRALLVAGYNAADTEKATTYLLNNDVTTDVGTKYKGSSSTEASLVVA